MHTAREPAFNVPWIVLAVLALLGLIHFLLAFVLSEPEVNRLLLMFAFIPARYDSGVLPDGAWPGGVGAEIWTFVSYALIHADLNHLIFNCVWLLAFGTPLARRFGALRFVVFMIVTAAAGAFAHLASYVGALFPMIGASAAISGTMAAAIRFVFQHGGPLSYFRRGEDETYHVPAASLIQSLRDPRVLAFIAVWFGVNLLFGLGSLPMPGVEQKVAWQAHIGGFVAGFLLFPLFDPPRRGAAIDTDIDPTTSAR